MADVRWIMKGTMVVNGFLTGGKYSEPVEMMSAAAERAGVGFSVVHNTELCIPVDDDDMVRKLDNPDFVLFWDKDVRCARNIELAGIPVFNRSECIRICDDKSLTHLALVESDVPSIPTVILPMTFDNIGYNDSSFISDIEDRFGYPMVVKDCFGSFGQQVHLVNDREEFISILDRPRPMIVQEYVECGSSDLRLEVVGGEVVAAVSRKGKDGDFRANTTNGGTMRPHDPTSEETELAIRASEAVGADFAGVDILYRNGEPVVCEVNSNAHIKNLRNCTGIDVSDHILSHIRGRLS